MAKTESGKNVTIYDIANKAGISASTVGSVMNGSWKSRRISEARANAIKQLADEMGYSVNLQASALRKERSRIIGMIVPMHDNRYFSSISQAFEEQARARGLFPIISSTLRDPTIELEAARLLLNYQVERIVCTGATDPDAIADMCHKRGVQSFNLDLPGSKAPSVISDNYRGAYMLTQAIIEKIRQTIGKKIHLLFIGGRATDHNTSERIKGFTHAINEAGLGADCGNVLACGYAAEKASTALHEYLAGQETLPTGIFVNSTISLEGIMNWFKANDPTLLDRLAFGCFDWDPFAALMLDDIIMIRQDVPAMVAKLYELMDLDIVEQSELIQIPPKIVVS